MSTEQFEDCQLNVYNIKAMLARAPARYPALRIDTNNTCNLQCVYCHNHRSDATISAEEMHRFLHECIISVATFQVGCIMEPTLDKRLVDFLEMIAASPAKPTAEFILQTNGILIHRHDQPRMQAAGLRRLSVSMDAADSKVQRDLRGGMSLEKVVRNIAGFRENCPTVPVEFITTVTSANVDNLQPLVEMGLEIGVGRFIFREMFYYPDNSVVDHSRMPGLLLKEGQFAGMEHGIRSQFDDRAELIFVSNDTLDQNARTMVENSGFEDRALGELRRHAT